MQARGFHNYRLKYCWPKVLYCICLPNELKTGNEEKNWRGGRWPRKILGGHGPPSPPLESPLTPVCHPGAHIIFSAKLLQSQTSKIFQKLRFFIFLLWVILFEPDKEFACIFMKVAQSQPSNGFITNNNEFGLYKKHTFKNLFRIFSYVNI